MTRFAGRLIVISLRLTLAVSILSLGVLVATVHLAPSVERSVFIIRGASMEPAIPLGSLIVVGAPRDSYNAGDVVSLRAGSTVVTHRIVAVDSVDGATRLTTRGDANDAADAAQASPSDVIGRVELAVPVAGIALAFLSEPIGLLAVMSFLGTLMFAKWLLDDMLAGRERPLRTRIGEGAQPAGT